VKSKPTWKYPKVKYGRIVRTVQIRRNSTYVSASYECHNITLSKWCRLLYIISSSLLAIVQDVDKNDNDEDVMNYEEDGVIQ